METMKEHGGGGGDANGVKPSAHVAKARACQQREREREKGTVRGPVYLACIHMQIPIDMTTFTYCIFALGHILARQFPIVGFRPPVRLIDIIGRAADTRLHFYLHTFANQFEPTPALAVRSTTLHTSRVRRSPSFRVFPPAAHPPRRLPDDFRSGVAFALLYTRVMFPSAGMRAGSRCDVDRFRPG